jgi:hypothetical protein
LYPTLTKQKEIEPTEKRTPNLNLEIVSIISKFLDLQFTNEKETTKNTFAPIDLLDYIYAVLHSPKYRKKYNDFLKSNFPRVPYPSNKETFWQLVKLGSEIRQLHLLESAAISKFVTKYPIDGSNFVGKIKFVSNTISAPSEKTNNSNNASINDDNKHDDISFPQYHLRSNDDTLLHEPKENYGKLNHVLAGKVFINETQYFDNVPEVAWSFYIGGYQPAQKWLKDRKERILSYNDILHYQKIIVALTETDRLMKEIDTLNFME